VTAPLSTLRNRPSAAVAAYLVLLLGLLSLAALSAARPDRLSSDAAWFPALLFCGFLAALVALVTASRPPTTRRATILVACGLVVSALGIAYLTGPRYWGIDFGGDLGLAVGTATLAGGALLVGLQAARGSLDRPTPGSVWNTLARVPVALVLAVPLATMFAVTGPVAAAIARTLQSGLVPIGLALLFAGVLRGRGDPRPARLAHVAAAVGGVLLLVGIAWHSRTCAGSYDPGPYVVSYDPAGYVRYDGCATVLKPLQVAAGVTLLLGAPVLHWVVVRSPLADRFRAA